MNINVLAVGKIKEQYLSDAVSEYAKRLSRFARISVSEVGEEFYQGSNRGEIENVKRKECERLSAKVKGFSVALDSGGREMSSEQLARFLDKLACSGVSEITFLIGGSNGLTKELVESCDQTLSFGKMTFPHQLMRVMLAEQLYRAFGINNNTPYHK